jgi:hypothetical protein
MTDLEKEAIKTNSTISSMRLGFFYIIKTIVFISIISILALIVCSIFKLPFDMVGVVALITALGVVAFGGKSVQSKYEKENKTLLENTVRSIEKNKEDFSLLEKSDESIHQ